MVDIFRLPSLFRNFNWEIILVLMIEGNGRIDGIDSGISTLYNEL